MTVVVSIAVYFSVYDYPAAAKFLTPKGRGYVLARLKGDSDAAREEKFTWTGVNQALKDPNVWFFCFCFHTVNLPMNAHSLFLTTIANELGYTAAQAQLLSILSYVAAFVFTIAAAIAERTKLRAPFIISGFALAIFGYIILMTSRRPEVSYRGTIIAASCVYSATAIVFSWLANNVLGQTKRATANTMQLFVGNLGAIAGTQLYRPK